VNRLRVAVIGAGRLGGFHAQKLAAMEDVELVAVADPAETARRRVAQQCHTRAVADHRELYGQVDGVVIAAPTKFHHRLGLAFLHRGIHVLMEKPLATTAIEARELVEAARHREVVLQVGHVERFNPALALAATHVHDPKYIEATRASGFTFRGTDVGVVLDLMIHDIDLVLSMVRSPVRRVDALGLSVMGGHEDTANARIEFESGCVATLGASRVSPWPVRQMNIWSRRGFAHVDFGARTATLIHPSEKLLRRQLDVDSLPVEEVEHLKEHLFDEHLFREDHEADAVDALNLELRDFVSAIGTPHAPRVGGVAGWEAIAVAEQILDRINHHAWDNAPQGPVGPRVTPPLPVVPAPHFTGAPKKAGRRLREAG